MARQQHNELKLTQKQYCYIVNTKQLHFLKNIAIKVKEHQIKLILIHFFDS